MYEATPQRWGEGMEVPIQTVKRCLILKIVSDAWASSEGSCAVLQAVEFMATVFRVGCPTTRTWFGGD